MSVRSGTTSKESNRNVGMIKTMTMNPFQKQMSIVSKDSLSHEAIINYVKALDQVDETMVLNKLRAKVCTKVFDFIKQMKQTNLWKRTLIKKTTKMKEHVPPEMLGKPSETATKDQTLSPRTMDLFVGYSRKVEEVGRYGELEVDAAKVRYLTAMLTLVFFAEKCYHDNERAEIYLAFRELFRVALLVPDHTLVMAAYEHIGIFNRNTSNYTGAIRAF